jgi:hypothetical protein
MKTFSDSAWQRTGITLLWHEEELAKIGSVSEARSLHAFLGMRPDFPEDLPSQNGQALVVGGLDTFLDLLPPDEAMEWLENIFRPILIDFQDWAQGSRGLIFWLPGGAKRVQMQPAQDQFTWECQGASRGKSLDLGRVLWSGASRDAYAIVPTGGDVTSVRGLYLKRIS